MLDDLFRWQSDRERIRASPRKGALERYLAYLVRRGHVTKVCRAYVGAAEHFGRWLGRQPLSRTVVRQFICRHLPVCQCPGHGERSSHCNSAALNRFLEMNGVGPASLELPRGLVGDLLERYEGW